MVLGECYFLIFLLRDTGGYCRDTLYAKTDDRGGNAADELRIKFPDASACFWN